MPNSREKRLKRANRLYEKKMREFLSLAFSGDAERIIELSNPGEEVTLLRKEISTLKDQISSLKAQSQMYQERVIELETINSAKISEAEHARLAHTSPDRLPALLRPLTKGFILLLSGGPKEVYQYFSRPKIPSEPLGQFPNVELLTLLYNSERFIPGYLKSLAKIDYPADRLSISILDNGSSDQSFQTLKEEVEKIEGFPFKIKIERSERNLGFAGGNNLLFRKSLSNNNLDYFFLLNADTEIESNCLNEITNFARKDRAIAITEAKQSPREHPKWHDPSSGDTGWCSCGGALISRDALSQVGLFDEELFLYCEDVDLSWRFWMNGFRCATCSTAIYKHYTEDLDAEKDRSNEMYYRIRNAFLLRYKFGSSSNEQELEHYISNKLIPEGVASQEIVRKATLDAKKLKLQTKFRALKFYLKPKGWWQVFSGLDFEQRR